MKIWLSIPQFCGLNKQKKNPKNLCLYWNQVVYKSAGEEIITYMSKVGQINWNQIQKERGHTPIKKRESCQCQPWNIAHTLHECTHPSHTKRALSDEYASTLTYSFWVKLRNIEQDVKYLIGKWTYYALFSYTFPYESIFIEQTYQTWPVLR